MKVLKPLYHFKAKDDETLYKKAMKIAWEEVFPSDKTFSIDAAVSSAHFTHSQYISLKLKDAIVDADVFIGVSVANILTANDIKTMAQDPVIFALANPDPEIMPEEALKGGAAIIATGRSDYPNQVNNVLAFPGIFRGALDCRARRITPKMKIAAAYAIANCLSEPDKENIIPKSLNKQIASKVAEAVKQAYEDYDK